VVRFTHANLVSGISAQLSAIPQTKRFCPSDLFLPADSLTNVHTLVLTLAALFSNSSVAFNSVSAACPDLAIATQGIAPTILVSNPNALLKTHGEVSAGLGPLNNFVHWFQTRSLTQGGLMPAASFLASINDSLRPSIGTTPGKLRLIFVAERAGASTPPLSSTVINDLRIFTGARIIYALAAPRVAGAVTQTSLYDYRLGDGVGGKCSHFGPPLDSTEIFLRDVDDHKTTDEKAEGEIVVRGPCVSGNEAALGVAGFIRDDNTLAYV